MEEQDFEDRIARAEAAVRQLSERVASLSAELDDARSQLARVGTEATAAASSAAEASDRLDDLEDAQGLSSEPDASSETVASADEGDSELFAYKTIVGPNGYIYVLVPRMEADQEGDRTEGEVADALTGPFGQEHIGTSYTPLGGKNAPPWPLDGGGAPTEVRPDNSWAHYSWKRIGPTGSDVVVYAAIVNGKYNKDTETTEGAYVEDFYVCTFAEWKTKCKRTWDDASMSGIMADTYFPIAHVSNGFVTQICFGAPFYSPVGWEKRISPYTKRDTDFPAAFGYIDLAHIYTLNSWCAVLGAPREAYRKNPKSIIGPWSLSMSPPSGGMLLIGNSGSFLRITLNSFGDPKIEVVNNATSLADAQSKSADATYAPGTIQYRDGGDNTKTLSGLFLVQKD